MNSRQHSGHAISVQVGKSGVRQGSETFPAVTPSAWMQGLRSRGVSWWPTPPSEAPILAELPSPNFPQKVCPARRGWGTLDSRAVTKSSWTFQRPRI